MVQKAVLYCRVSTADQSCERQEQELTDFAQRAGYEVVEVFKETASGARKERELRSRVMKLAQGRYINAILVTELSRWSRSTIDVVETMQSLQSWGVSIIALSGLQFDLTTPHGKMMATVMASLAEFERDLIRERVKSGIAMARMKGKKIGRQKGDFVKSKKLEPKVDALGVAIISQKVWLGMTLGNDKTPKYLGNPYRGRKKLAQSCFKGLHCEINYFQWLAGLGNQIS